MENWTEVLIKEFLNLWRAMVLFLPRLFFAILVLILGWFLSSLIEKIIRGFLKKINLDKFFERTGWKEALEKAEVEFSPSSFVGEIVKWILVIVFLSVSLQILFAGYGIQFTFLEKLILWLPNLVVAVVILIVGIVVANILEKIVKASLEKVKISYSAFFGGLVRWAIYIFVSLLALYQLGVTQRIIEILIFSLTVTFALALGLAFGLGGKDLARDILKEIKEKLK